MILVIGRFAIDPARRDAFLDFAHQLVRQERAAEGCMSFELLEDVIAPNRFMMMEQWDSQAAFEHHADTPEAEITDNIFESFLAGEASFDTYEF
jgi:quinol monooxygenase YgiN